MNFISLVNEVVYFQQDGYFKAKSLNEIAQLLGDKQKMSVKRCSMEDLPRKLNTFPKVTTKTEDIFPTGQRFGLYLRMVVIIYLSRNNY